MARIGQLMISGVRSVGVEEQDAHIIKFLNPLTIISGPNGTGKTTIIECLNYVTTGELPAGKLATFIHNLKVSKRSRVDSMVKLQFFDSKNRECVATKRMTSSQTKGDKLKTESEEFTIQINNNGVIKKISSKVADFRKEMLNLLGIPTAILDSVVFCHQEDSCWPLSEPKELKRRFDRIFQLTKFVKAAEQIKKVKKEYENELKVVSEKKNNAEMVIQNKARYMQDEIDTEKTKKDSLERLDVLRLKIEECNLFIRECNEKLIRFEKNLRTLDLKKSELRMKQDQLKSLNVPPFAGSLDMIQREINDLTSSTEYLNLQNQKADLETKVKSLQREIEEFKKLRLMKEEEMVRIRSAEMHRSNLMNELGSLEKLITSSYGLRPGKDLDHQMNELVLLKRSELDEIKTNASSVRTKYEAQLEDAQSEFNKANFELSNINSSVRKLENEIQQAEIRLQSATNSKSTIAILNSEISILEEKLANTSAVDEYKASGLRHERQIKQEKLNEIRSQLRQSEEFEETEREIARKTEDLEMTQNKLSEMRNKHWQSFVDLFGEAPSGLLSQKVSLAQKDCAADQSVAENALSRAQLNADREKQNLRQLDESENSLKEEADELTSNIFNTSGCIPDDVSYQLVKVKSDLTLARKELAPLNTKALLYKSWSEEVQEKSCCPLCERRFNSKSGVADLSSKLLNMSISFPEDITKLENDVTMFEEKERVLATACNEVDRLKKINDTLNGLEEKRSSLEKSFLKETEEVKQRKIDLDSIKRKAEKLSSIQMDVALIDNYIQSVENLMKEIQTLKSRLPSSTSVSCAELKKMVNEYESEINSIVAESERLQIAAKEHNTIAGKLNSLRERRVALGETAAQATMISEQLTTKRYELDDLKNRGKFLDDEMPASKKKVESARFKKEEAIKTARDDEMKMMNILNELSTNKAKLDELVMKLTQLSVNKNQLENCTGELQKIDEQMLQKNMMIDRLENQVSDMDSIQLRRRTLEDQMSRMILENSIQKINEEIQSLDVSEADTIELRRIVDMRNREREKAEIEKGRIDGQMLEIEKKRREAQMALSRKEMRDAETNYRDIIVDRVICENTINDLEKYRQCLDSSILQFHTEKMSAINEILDDLWRKVYKGGDIESIKIKSDIATTTTDKRKSYDYKVIMLVEGGIEMDMRDRCSAGQKMLACILIRIALADVFGGICSMIALDEPTTNLDVHKVEYLAEMLNDLIAARRNDDDDGYTKGRQFQMIVITHDERLVERLTLGTRPDFFYVLGKNSRGLSYIQRKYPDGHTELTHKKT